MKEHWKTNSIILLILAIIIYMVSISSYSGAKEPIKSYGAQNTTDSLRLLREYRSSQRYKDSVAQWRLDRQDSITKIRERTKDSMVVVRQQMRDSMNLVRAAQIAENQRKLDSARTSRLEAQNKNAALIQQRKDSINAIREYRSSQAYKDSIAYVRQQKQDSIKAIRLQIQDSLRDIQVAFRDSMVAEREKTNAVLKASIDSMRNERQMVMDSMNLVREQRRDSLAKIKSEREIARQLKQEEKEEQRKLKIALDIQKKQDAYTNEDLRKKKWSAPRRFLQNLFTRYNFWFNTNEALRAIEENIIRIHHDDLSNYIPIFIVDPEKYQSQLASEMDSLIQRASLGIQIHDPRSKWQDDLYFIVGKSYYYKGDYKNAQAAFRYVITIGEEIKTEYKKKHPKWHFDAAQFSMPPMKGKHEPARNEAIIWLAKAMVAEGDNNKAVGLLQMVQNESQFPDHLQANLHLELANIFLKQGQIDRALPSLIAVSEAKELDPTQKVRVNFLLGQIFQEKEDLYAANQYFNKLSRGNVPLDLGFFAQLQKHWNNFILGIDPLQAQEYITQLASESRYQAFSDKAYLSLAQTYALQENYQEAIAALQKSIEASQDPLISSESYTRQGDYNYEILKYEEALSSYQNALQELNPNLQAEFYHRATQRSNALTVLVPQYVALKSADSLYRLAHLPEREQKRAIQEHLRVLKQSIRDSISTAERSQNSDPALALNQRAPERVGGNNFYFDNPQLVQQGLQEFKDKWGNRPLQDNWRKESRAIGHGSELNYNTEQELVLEIDAEGLPTEAYLLAQIPQEEKELQAIHDSIGSYLFLVGKGYYTLVEDYNLSFQTLSRFIKEYPDHNHLAEAYYYLYLITDKAPQLGDKNVILNTMKQSIGVHHRLVVQIEESLTNDAIQDPLQEDYEYLYDELYELYNRHQYVLMLDQIKDYKENNLSFKEYEAQVALLKILGEIGVQNIEDAKLELELFIIQYPEKEQLIQMANAIKEKLNSEEGWDQEEMIQAIQHSYILNENDIYEIIIKANNNAESMVLKSSLSDFNLMSEEFGTHGVNIQSFNAEDNIIIITDFPNLRSANQYIQAIKRNQILSAQLPVNERAIRPISKGNLQRLLYTKNWEEYEHFFQNHLNK